MGLGVVLPTKEQYELRSKARLHELGTAEDLPVPRAEVLLEPDPLYTLHERIPFPLVVKGVFYGAEVCHSVDEATRAFHRMEAEWGLPVIVQEFVAGDEFDVAAVGDGEGGVLGAVPMRKLMLTKLGKGWAGVTVDDPELVELTGRVMSALRWRGPCEIEIMRTPRGEYQLLEINPRFPAWVDLSAGAGQNLPLAVARLAAGESVDPLPPHDPGVAFVRASIDQIVPISALEAMTTAGEMGGAPLVTSTEAQP
jgi:carbamoyl-phosphate synthase large subunit